MPINANLSMASVLSTISCARCTIVRLISDPVIRWAFSRSCMGEPFAACLLGKKCLNFPSRHHTEARLETQALPVEERLQCWCEKSVMQIILGCRKSGCPLASIHAIVSVLSREKQCGSPHFVQ